MPSDERFGEVQRAVADIAHDLEAGRIVSGPREAALASACRRMVVKDMIALLRQGAAFLGQHLLRQIVRTRDHSQPRRRHRIDKPDSKLVE